MDDIPLSALFSFLAVLIVLSGFFSGSETGLMTINRYRLAHRAQQGDRGSRLAHGLLQRPDRLIGLILLGNNLVNILAASTATVIGLRLFGEAGIAIASGVLTLVILLFGEVAPKT
ncbi:MAG: CNNM domain-containing protein, partial [Algiphilus sp.]